MTGGYHVMRVLKKHDSGIMYAAVPDLLKYYEQAKLECKTPEEEQIWIKLIDKFTNTLYESIDHDL
jgi:hypothetical protein